jgi:hypothetical protein
MIEIERELEDTLHRALDPLAARPIPPRRGLDSGRAVRTVAGGAGAAFMVKLLTGVAAAAALLTVAAGATTGSINPADWGQQVAATVESCKDDLANSGTHGIGGCVSAFASQHGKTVSGAAQHHGSTSNNGGTSNNGNSGGNGGGNGNAGSHGKGKSNNHTPPPTKTS